MLRILYGWKGSMDVFFVEQSAFRREITQRSRFTRKSPVVATATSFSPIFIFSLKTLGPLLIICCLDWLLKAWHSRRYLFVLSWNWFPDILFASFSLDWVVWSVLIPVEREIFALAKEKCSGCNRSFTLLVFALDQTSFGICWTSTHPPLRLLDQTLRPIGVSSDARFHLFRSLAPKFLISCRCGREDKVSSRLEFHPTSDSLLFSPARVAQPLHHPPLRVVEQSSLWYPPFRRLVAFIARVVTYLVLMLLRHCGSWKPCPIRCRSLFPSDPSIARPLMYFCREFSPGWTRPIPCVFISMVRNFRCLTSQFSG